MGGVVNRRDLLLAAGGTLLAPAIRSAQAQGPGLAPGCDPNPAWGRINCILPRPGENPFADAESRRRFWLPEPPEDRRSRLRAFFDRVYQPRYAAYLQAQVPSLLPLSVGSLPSTPAPLLAFDSRSEKSENWSGAYVAATEGGMFTLVVGQWQEPAPELPTEAEQDYDAARVCRGSIWIGLDGQRAYRDSTLPQIGTEHERDASGFRHRAWFQWWTPLAEDDPLAQPQYINTLPIQAGDRITCALWIPPPDPLVAADPDDPAGRARAGCFMIRERAGVATFILPFEIFAPSLTKSPRPPAYPKVTGATAQWIVERPKEIPVDPEEGRHRPVILPDYGEVTFSDCLAGLAEAPGAPVFATRQPETGRFIAMYNRRIRPRRTVIISSVDRPANVTDSVTLRYGRGAG